MIRVFRPSCIVLLLVVAGSLAVAKPKDKHVLPSRTTAGVDHIVVVMMEKLHLAHGPRGAVRSR